MCGTVAFSFTFTYSLKAVFQLGFRFMFLQFTIIAISDAYICSTNFCDSQLLAEATKRIFGSLKNTSGPLSVHYNDSDAVGAHETVKVNNSGIPGWAQVLEPVRKLPTNVGARIRKCIYDALDKDPPEWARKRLEHSISKEVYKGNASGPTKVLIISIILVPPGGGGGNFTFSILFGVEV